MEGYQFDTSKYVKLPARPEVALRNDLLRRAAKEIDVLRKELITEGFDLADYSSVLPDINALLGEQANDH